MCIRDRPFVHNGGYRSVGHRLSVATARSVRTAADTLAAVVRRSAARGVVARGPTAQVALSTASTYPESTASAFELAARLGYDGLEVMVWTDPVSPNIKALL